jgi:hypothetical protein
VESSETILLRRLILFLINQNSLLLSLAYEQTGPRCACLLEIEIICFASTTMSGTLGPSGQQLKQEKCRMQWVVFLRSMHSVFRSNSAPMAVGSLTPEQPPYLLNICQEQLKT